MSEQQPQPKIVSLRQLVETLLSQGYHPRDVRKQLASRGIRWQYRFSNVMDGRRQSHQGGQEMVRRLRQQRLCVNGCGGTATWQNGQDTCTDCLAAKWGAESAAAVPTEGILR